MGTAFSVERTYLGGQFASGEGVTLDCTRMLDAYLYQEGGEPYVWWEYDGRRRQVQLRDVEWLVEQICGIELVQGDWTSLSSGDRLSWLSSGSSTELYTSKALCDAGDSTGWGRSTRWVVGIRSLVSDSATNRGSRLWHAIRRLWCAAVCGGLSILARVASISGDNGLRGSKLARGR